MALFHRWCTEQSTEKVEWISDVPFRVRSSTVSLWGMKRRAANLVTTPGFDPQQNKGLPRWQRFSLANGPTAEDRASDKGRFMSHQL